MKILHIKRITKHEQRHTVKMGVLHTKVTYIKQCLFGWPIKTLHKYRETYYGEVKDCNDIMLFI